MRREQAGIAGLWTQAEAHPDELALADSQCQLTWSEVADKVNRAADALNALGLGSDTRLAVFAENSAETLIIYAAAIVGGVSAVVVNFHLGVEELEYILRESDAAAIWADSATVGTALEAANKVGGVTVVVHGMARSGTLTWKSLTEAADPSTPSLARPATFELIFTSGTTGYPKAVRKPFEVPDTVGELLAALPSHPLAEMGAHLAVSPLYHSGPHSSAVNLVLSGGSVVVLGRFDAETTLRAIQDYRVASTLMVPTHFVRMLALGPEVRQQFDVSSLKLIAHTGSNCPISVKRAIIDWFGPILREAYGSTEAGTVASITSDEWLLHPGSVGRAADGFSVTVVDDDGAIVAPGVEGRLCFSAPGGRVIRYHNDLEAANETHVLPGLFTIGEIGYVDDDGYIYITDRSKDMVVSGGVNIYPAECERVLRDHPAVMDAVVFGIPDPEMGERVIGLAVTRDSTISGVELVEYGRSLLAHYKVPKRIDLVPEIPRNAMGKVNKRLLRDWFLQNSGS